MYDYIYGSYVSCIVMCHLVCMEILKSPFNYGQDDKLFNSGFYQLVEENKNRGWIDETLEKKMKKLNRLRNNFEHSKNAKRVVNSIDSGDSELAKQYNPHLYPKLEKKALFAMKLVNEIIWDFHLRLAPAESKNDETTDSTQK